MIKTSTDIKFNYNPRRELYDSRDNVDIYIKVFDEIEQDLSSNWFRYDFKRTYYYDFKQNVIFSNRDRFNDYSKLDSFRLFTFNINQYSKNKVVSKYKQMVKERNYENLDFSWDELYAEIHSIFKKKIEKLNTIAIPKLSEDTKTLSFRLIAGEYCYMEVDSNVIVNALLYMTYGRDVSLLNSSTLIQKFERLIEKYDITKQEVTRFFNTNTFGTYQYSSANLIFLCKFVSRDKVLEVINNLFSIGISREILLNQITKHRDGYVNDEDIQFFVDYIQNLPDN